MAQSQSVTGKTAAFVLASLCRVDCNENTPQVIILSPTYELALQTGEVAQQMAKYKPQIKFRFAVRGENIPRGQQLREHVIIGTPGRLMDWAHKYRVFDLKKVKVFVLDEVDVIIDTQGSRQQSIRIQKALPPDCQTMLFSATYDSKVMEFAEMIAEKHGNISDGRWEMGDVPVLWEIPEYRSLSYWVSSIESQPQVSTRQVGALLVSD
jgi:ATP-dependent RNA helicase DDX19/DBP5